jgi:hypothetical protein
VASQLPMWDADVASSPTLKDQELISIRHGISAGRVSRFSSLDQVRISLSNRRLENVPGGTNGPRERIDSGLIALEWHAISLMEVPS